MFKSARRRLNWREWFLEWGLTPLDVEFNATTEPIPNPGLS